MFNDHLKTLPQYFLPKQALTRLAGLLANVRAPAVKNLLIRRFVQQYQVNMNEACEQNIENYPCFNDFFIRMLKPGTRPIADAEIVSPVDGIVSELGSIKKGQILQAKGRYYTVEQLLACNNSLSEQFINGRFATLYLSPKDYHRVHMPMDAVLKEMVYVPGKLFSVQPTTARVIPHLFARNERLVSLFDTKAGLMAMVLVGATIVGAIGTRWQGELKRSRRKQYFNYTGPEQINTQVHQGEEMGYFKLGSTVVLLFADGERVHWLNHLMPGLGIRYGQAFGRITTKEG
ncbi:archaetidylserine decarboxylase [Legionella jordanis]|uniref:Phosphatidylserine decarboxylase proenzyme n=1 Tax=Legionella jordanis TaxID=456 RepID=A0A0W0VCZ8_9GAMM|nr:archaetidylserine decarboxylase [Legionella jordanis]KTD17960.1 phosphatidylserine decarboxylase [Legionella jordanis]RMX02347.1 phosphatidylserine decarboxylase [Legionella jordanis]RMX15773.1 phosphatidylserine decarboxylase [Legionella jordanis]VEH13948.1 phosphatidylserine decarboxylase [Legionella jordanis]HAT8714326.1 phosphatidylserine decarboxylase [Legionella jordanis]